MSCLAEIGVVEISFGFLHFIVELGAGAPEILKLFDIVSRRGAGQGRKRHRLGNLGVGVQKRMRQDVAQRGALGGVEVQNSGDEVARGVGNRNVVREGIAVHSNFLVRGFHIGGLEGGLADD